MNTNTQAAEALRKAAQAVIDRWNSPNWVGAGGHVHTGELIANLAAALATTQQAEPPAAASNSFIPPGSKIEVQSWPEVGKGGGKTFAERKAERIAQNTAAADGLPELPEDPEGTVEVDCGPAPGGGREVMFEDGYSAAQMRAYAREALALRAVEASGNDAIGLFASHELTPGFRKHYQDRLDVYADKHPALVVRHLAQLLREALALAAKPAQEAQTPLSEDAINQIIRDRTYWNGSHAMTNWLSVAREIEGSHGIGIKKDGAT